MKYVLVYSILLIFIVLSAKSQDKIITTNLDTIACKILRSNNQTVRFRMFQNGIETVGKLDRAKIKQLIISNENSEVRTGNNFPHRWRAGFSGGLGDLLGSTDKSKSSAMSMGLTEAQADEYIRQLLIGYQAGASFHYFLKADLAIGLNYRIFATGADLWINLDPMDGVHMYYGKMKENMYVNFAGVSVFSRMPITANRKLELISAISVGMTMYRDETSILATNYLITGKSFGSAYDLGLEYFIVKKMSLGFNINVFSSRIKKLTLNDGYSTRTATLNKEDRENVSSLDLSTGLKFYF